ncbi:MAG: hypothetical protein ACOH1M_03815 [Rhodoglobus sp.]
MNQRLGMDPGAARAKRDAMRTQVDMLRHISSELGHTADAANNPLWYGIQPGERTVAPWSMDELNSARFLLDRASNAARGLLDRIGAEAAAQESTSAAKSSGVVAAKQNLASADGPAIVDVVKDIRRTRTFLFSGPRSWLQTPAAIGTLKTLPWLGASTVMPSTWFSLVEYKLGADLVKSYGVGQTTNRFVRSSARAANAFKPDVILQSAANVLRQGDAGWVKNTTSWLSKSAPVVGKAFGVLGAGFGAYSLYNGIVGMSDGEVTDADGWAVVDGVVGIVTGLGALIPPPVGVVFAAVGGAYALGRWLFGEDESGKSGIEHVGSFFSDWGDNISEAHNERSQAVADFVSDPIGTARDIVSDPVGAARSVFDNLWPG